MKKIMLILLLIVFLITSGVQAWQFVGPTSFKWVRDTTIGKEKGEKVYDIDYGDHCALTDFGPQIVVITVRYIYTDWGRQYHQLASNVKYDIMGILVNLTTGALRIYSSQSYDQNDNKIGPEYTYVWVTPAPGTIGRHIVDLAGKLPNSTEEY